MASRRTIALTAFALVAIVAVVVVGRGGVPWRRTAPPARGDASRGAKLYETLPCVSCHDISRPWPGGDICPNLGNIATEAARIVRQSDYRGRATDAAGYIRESIVDPNAYVLAGPTFSAEGRSLMPSEYGQSLKPEQVDQIVAYLLTLK